jgi:uncharacterized DUF497 family protein
LVGQSLRHRILVVILAERSESVIRLVSARLANRRERRTYEEDA